jgi:NTP pyrophosphatase (non-canonical NTP hydrolase)
MQPGEYIKAVLQTESCDYGAIRIRTSLQIRLLHALLGINTENGELQDQLKKHLFYNKPLDLTNLKEELGDLLWYVALAMDELGFTFEDVWERNIEKLKARYGSAFNEKGALRRDEERERRAIEVEGPGGATTVHTPNARVESKG